MLKTLMPPLNTTLPRVGGWVKKFSLAHSTEEPQASAGELQLSW